VGQADSPMPLSFLCRSQALESIVAYALLRAAPTLVSSLGPSLLGYLFAGNGSHPKHKSLIMFVFQKLNGIGLSAGHDGFRAGVRAGPAVICGLGHQSRPDGIIFDVPAQTQIRHHLIR
jgi:hypothetical protein